MRNSLAALPSQALAGSGLIVIGLPLFEIAAQLDCSSQPHPPCIDVGDAADWVAVMRRILWPRKAIIPDD